MDQQELWHDTLEDALRTVVDAAGGPKKVADKLWPSMPLADAARKLNHCLDPERAEKLTPREIQLLLQWGREHNCHAAMVFLNRECGYHPPEPTDPETEIAKAKREFVEAAEKIERLGKRICALDDRIKLARSA